VAAIWETLYPSLNSTEHVPMQLEMWISECRVVKNTADVVQNLVYWHIRIIPCIDYPRRYIL